MTLLGWMHRKFRQNSSNDPFKDFSTGTTSNYLVSGRASLEDHRQLSQVTAHSCQTRDGDILLFGGLLSIGTLGSVDPIEELEENEEAEQEPQPQLHESAAVTIEVIAEKEETELATESDLMIINTELEKVLTEAAEKEGVEYRISSARPSHVSSRAANEACPLQEYLFAGLAAAEGETEKGRKDKRISLGELFMIEEGGGKEVKKKKGEGKGVNVMMKRMLTRRGTLKGSSQRSDGGAAAADGGKDATAAKSAKFQKILQIFHKKIHPENATKKSSKSGKYKSKYNTSCIGNNCCIGCGGCSMMTPTERTNEKENRCGIDQPSFLLDGSDSVISREHWIKTDADYLVLEL